MSVIDTQIIKPVKGKKYKDGDNCKINILVEKSKVKNEAIITMQILNESQSNTLVKVNAKTKKNKKLLTNQEKQQLWYVFDTDRLKDIPQTSSNVDVIYEHVSEKESGMCNVCNSLLMIMEDGFPTCTNTSCGIIYRQTLDYSPEWRFYGAEDKNATDPTRCGNPINPLLVESSYGCKVLCNSKSSYEMKKIRKWTEWQSMPHKEKSLYDEFQFITVMAQNAGIPKIFIDHAMAIHKDISEQQMFRGMHRDGIKAASIYISCRLNGCPRTANEIADIFKIDKTSATTGCSAGVNILHNIERSMDPSRQSELCATTPTSFIDRFCSKLGVNVELTLVAKFICKKIEVQNFITDHTPNAIAAGLVYFISQNCNLNISKGDIETICGVSQVTVNKCFKKMDVLREDLIPKCILDKYK